MEAKIIKARAEHIEHIVAHIRAWDKTEMLAYNGMEPLESINESLKNSEDCWTGVVSGIPVCMFGVAESNYIWLVGTDDVDKYNKLFLVKSKRFLNKMLKKYSRLENYVEQKNTRSVQWLGWLGFNMEKPEPMGPNNELFIHFWLCGNISNKNGGAA
jgi:hypothetical protein